MLRSTYLPELSPTLALPGHDYPYRGYASHEQVAAAMVQATLDIGYTNFKSEVTRKQGNPRHDLYMRVWSVMNGAEATLDRMAADDRRWKERQQSGWFSEGSSKKAQKAYDKKSDGQLAFTDAPHPVTLYPEDHTDPFTDDPDLVDTGQTLGEFDMAKLSAQLDVLRSKPMPQPRRRRGRGKKS